MKKPPASSTLLTHNAALQLVFKEAIEQKWMIAAQVPVLSSKGETGTRRAAFSEEEYDAILNEIYESEQNAHSEKTRQIRELLYDYCEIAVNTGIRPGTEMEHLTWKDIEIKTQGSKAQFFINVSKGKAFEKALQSSGLKESPRGPRTLYSLRHTYITWQLLDGTSIDIITRQSGTSTEMIEQHYSHVKPKMFADALKKYKHSLHSKLDQLIRCPDSIIGVII